MGYLIGDCPACGARLIVEYKDADKHHDLRLDGSTLDIEFVARCWKCGKVVKSTSCTNVDEQPMDIGLLPEDEQKLAEHLYKVVETRDLSKWEKSEG